jgi:hypothetical protein
VPAGAERKNQHMNQHNTNYQIRENPDVEPYNRLLVVTCKLELAMNSSVVPRKSNALGLPLVPFSAHIVTYDEMI